MQEIITGRINLQRDGETCEMEANRHKVKTHLELQADITRQIRDEMSERKNTITDGKRQHPQCAYAERRNRATGDPYNNMNATRTHLAGLPLKHC